MGCRYVNPENPSLIFRKEIIRKHGSSIYVILESHLLADEKLVIDGYEWFGHNRRDISTRAWSGSGGVGFLVKRELLNKYGGPYDMIKLDDSSEDILWMKLCLHDDHNVGIILCAAYLPPVNSSRGDRTQEFFDNLLAQAYMLHDGSMIKICTDLNGHIGQKQDCDISELVPISRTPLDDRKSDKRGDSIIEFLYNSTMCILNGRFTGDNYTSISNKGVAVSDYMIVSQAHFKLIKDFKVLTVTEATDRYGIVPHVLAKRPDHSLLTSHFSFSQFHDFCDTSSDIPNQGSLNDSSIVHRKYNVKILPDDLFYSDQCRNSLLSIIDRLEKSHMIQSDIDQMYDDLLSTIHTEMDSKLDYKDYSPSTKKRRRNKKPHWNDELEKLWGDVKSLERIYLKEKVNRIRREKRQAFVNKRNEFDKALKKAERRYNATKQTGIHHLRSANPQAFWDQLDELGPGKKSGRVSDSVKLSDGTQTSDIQVVLAKWRTDFEQLYKLCDNGPINNDMFKRMENISEQWSAEYANLVSQPLDPDSQASVDVHSANDILNRDITYEETCNALRMSKNGKAVGIDNIANEILKCDPLSASLHRLFQAVFEHNIVPSMWWRAMIHPALKKGKSPLFPLSHRGLSLMSTICKVFGSILNQRLMLYLETNEILVEEQNGFRKLRSCLDHIFVLTTIIRNRLQQNLSTYCCFIDFEKAFDSVHYPSLWYKMLAYRIHGRMLNVIKTLYENLENSVRVNGRLTDWFSQTAGVRQGDVLSPTLFALYINDLAYDVKQFGAQYGVKVGDDIVNILLFADDVVLISDSEVGLQLLLNITNNWARDWRLRFNMDKTNIVHFRKPSVQCTSFPYTLGSEYVKYADCYRYLGLTISEHLDYTVGTTILNKASSKALGRVTSKFLVLNGLSHSTYKAMFNCMVCPVMDYSAAIWGCKEYACFNTTQHRAMRSFLGVGMQTPVAAMYSDLKWCPPHIRHKLAALRYWWKLTHQPSYRLSRKIFDWDYSLALNNKSCWSTDVKKILIDCDMENYFSVDNWYNTDFFKFSNFVKTALTNKWQSSLKERSLNMSRMKLFYEITFDHCTHAQPYINIRSRQKRSVLAKIRMGCLKLKIETGRYRSIPEAQRICDNCDLNEVENEKHFIFYCSKHTDIRNDKLNCLLDNDYDDVQNLKMIFSDVERSKKFASYLLEGLENRIS